MKSDRILKKAVFGGFKRADVLDYVEKLQRENVSLAEELRQKCADSSEIESIRAEYEKMKSELGGIKAELEEALPKLREAEEKAAALGSENAALRETLSSKENELSSIEREYAVFRNDKSNALIQDAMKYSDTLVDTAKESAGRALVKAGDSINAASLDIKTAGERVRTAQVNLDYSLNSVKSSVDKLIEELESAVDSLHPGE